MAGAAAGTDFDGLAAGLQRQRRLPSLAAGVARGDQTLWAAAVGLTDVSAGERASVGTQYRIGSITKTFTAATVLALAEDGALDLDERVERYVSAPVGRATLRQLLAHIGGVPREAPTPMWETFTGPDRSALLAALPAAVPVDQPGRQWHYSNLGYALLGQIVEQVTGTGCEKMIAARLWEPLGLSRTSWQAAPPAARGYRLDPYQDVLRPEPNMDQGAVGVGGQAWSTVADLLRWGHALSGGVPQVLPARVVETMHTLQVMLDPQRWTRGWGAGLILERRGERVLAGHTGAMPGFLAALSVDRGTGVTAVALANATRGARLSDFTADLVDRAESALPAAQQELWTPGSACPPELAGVLGRWWSEAEETLFTWRDGALRAHLAADPDTTQSVFSRDGRDRYHVAAGREYGETLLILRDQDGHVSELRWATYPYGRDPR